MLRELLIAVGITAAAGMLFALLGPFGTYDNATLAERMLYWVMLSVAGCVFYMPMMVGGARAAERLDLSYAALLAAGVLIASLPMTAVVMIATYGGLEQSFELYAARYGNVVLLAGIICAVFWLRYRHAAPEGASAVRSGDAAGEGELSGGANAAPQSSPPAPLADRLPAGFGPILALESEDHYVRIHGQGRSELVLMRLGDAAREMGAEAGLRTHRSWWVAADAVEALAQDGRTLTLRLKNGLGAPVSRSNQAQARALFG